ncbi:putative sporulation protein YyaC [Lentibacillus halodurans]|uniref:Putative sporulation protein YyaC n=1 Tax=Lentibacillus halodurans TaxID=237679 RepID=A0A1I0ZWH9_9BACI|nr:spore protease YyaC [Lentibacillus halodurans]SFB29931.1 putative sporulation protein YyaC [Lentibacillus halodurans]
MNLMDRFIPKKEKLQIHYSDQDLLDKMNERIISWLPSTPKEYIIVCIGTDRSTGDALGPLTGSFLSDMQPKHLRVYGTLPEPVHATNMEDYVNQIYKLHRHPFIIAVDASLGKTTSVGSIITDIGSLNPGAALNKNLPPIGDIHITGVVNISGFMEYAILQNTRLSLVVDMAKHIAALLKKIDQQLTYSKTFPDIVTSHKHQVLKN